MKKLFRKQSLLLAAVMLFSMLSTSVMAVTLQGTARMSQAPVIVYNTNYYGRLTDVRNSIWYKFKTKSYDAFYTITVKNVSIEDNISAYITDAYQEEIDKYTYFWKNSSFVSNIKLKKSKWYYIHVINHGSGSGNVKLNLTVKKDAVGDTMKTAKEISVNKSFFSSLDGKADVDYVKFKAARSGYHRFIVKNVSIAGNISTYILNSHEEELAYKSYFYKNDYLDTKVKLTAGRWYYVKIVTHGETGNYKVLVKR